MVRWSPYILLPRFLILRTNISFLCKHKQGEKKVDRKVRIDPYKTGKSGVWLLGRREIFYEQNQKIWKTDNSHSKQKDLVNLPHFRKAINEVRTGISAKYYMNTILLFSTAWLLTFFLRLLSSILLPLDISLWSKKKIYIFFNTSWCLSVLMCFRVRIPRTWWIRVQCRGRPAGLSFLGHCSHYVHTVSHVCDSFLWVTFLLFFL